MSFIVWWKLRIEGDFYVKAYSKDDAICKAHSEFRWKLKDFKIIKSIKAIPSLPPHPIGSQYIEGDFPTRE